MMLNREKLVAYLEDEVRTGRLSSVAAERIIDKIWEQERETSNDEPNRAA